MTTGELPAGTSGRLVCGRYRLQSPLGQGGMGVVWLAHDELLDRPVAVKEVVTPAVPVGDRDALHERMLREARAAARLDHPGAVRIYDVVEEDEDPVASGQPWIVMEILTGRSLQDAVKGDGPLPVRRVAEIGVGLIDAIVAAHRADILHRDIKPGNVQLCDDGRVVLTDFGIASIAGDSSITRTGDIVGSPAYMSPERARGAALGPESDLFALGATLYTAVEGTPPFERDTPLATLTAVVHDPPAPYQRAGALRPVLEGLLTKDPHERMTADTARTLLGAVSRGESVPDVTGATTAVAAPPPTHDDATQAMPALDPGVATETARRRSRPSGRLALAAIAVGVLGALVWYFAIRDGSPGRTALGQDADGPFSPGQGPVPAAWDTYTDPSGWSLSMPHGWLHDDQSSLQRFRRPPDAPYGYIAVLPQRGASPRAVLESLAGPFARTHEAYDEVSFDATRFRGAEAAELTFTYRDQGTELEASQLAFSASTANGPVVYVLWWQTKPEDWESSQELREKLVVSFHPAA